MEADKYEYALSMFKLKYENQFDLVEFSRFSAPITKELWKDVRRNCKELLLQKVAEGQVEIVDERRQVYKFIDKKIFPGYNNRYNLVGKQFVELNVTTRTAIIYNKEGMVKCHMCGYIPAHCQAVFNVLVGDEETEVIMCPNCNRVILEA